MIFSTELPPGALVELCRSLRHNLGAGLAAQKVLGQLAVSASRRLRPVAGRLHASLERGESLASAFRHEQASFPPLLVALASVGEQTGQLPEVLGQLERYYLLQRQLRRQLLARSLLPIIQFFLAILVITVMLLVIGFINQSRGSTTFGIRGPGAAGRFLLVVGGILAGLAAGYVVLRRSLRRKEAVDALLLRVPAVGPCLQALALGRFALALQLTLDSSLSIRKAVQLSLRATGNGVYAGKEDAVTRPLRAGESLTTALGKARLFPEEFLQAVAVAEQGGRVPEMMRHQAEHYQAEAERRLRALTRAATTALWVVYAGLMIFAIFRLAGAYLGALGV